MGLSAVRDGKVVRLFMGNFDDQTVYSNDPVKVAREWESQGATLIHIVDLDGAKEGRPRNLSVVKKISKAVKCRIQLGGGIRTMDDIKNAFGHGAWRIILGTAACFNRPLVSEVIEQFGARIAIAVDVVEKEIVSNGWMTANFIDAVGFAKDMQKLGANTLVYTDTVKDGTLEGVRIEAVKSFMQKIDIPVVVAGGVGSLDDIKQLLKLKPQPEGVIVGKALYEKKIDLKKAIALC